VLDVPATLSAPVRVLASGRSNKNDVNDGYSIAVAALHAPTLRAVEAADHAAELFGFGAVGAAIAVGYTRDVRRFATRDLSVLAICLLETYID
jgi:hypothetical protein